MSKLKIQFKHMVLYDCFLYKGKKIVQKSHDDLSEDAIFSYEG